MNKDDDVTPRDRDHHRAEKEPNNPLHTASPTTSRRDAIRLAVLFSIFVSTTPSANALEFSSLLPKDSADNNINTSTFVPAKRATAYLVNSTQEEERKVKLHVRHYLQQYHLH